MGRTALTGKRIDNNPAIVNGRPSGTSIRYLASTTPDPAHFSRLVKHLITVFLPGIDLDQGFPNARMATIARMLTQSRIAVQATPALYHGLKPTDRRAMRGHQRQIVMGRSSKALSIQ